MSELSETIKLRGQIQQLEGRLRSNDFSHTVMKNYLSELSERLSQGENPMALSDEINEFLKGV